MEEIWKDIKDYEGCYQVSNQGRIKNKKKGKILKPGTTKGGYNHISLWKNNKGTSKSVHRLVWETFNGPIPTGMDVNHKNEIKTDNRLENLNILTRRENLNWGTHNERMAKTKNKPVLQYDLSGVFIKKYESTIDASRQTGINEANISACCLNKRKWHRKGYYTVRSAGKYVWKYVNN